MIPVGYLRAMLFHLWRLNLKKGILTALFAFASQANAFQYADGIPSVSADLLVWKVGVSIGENWGQIITPSGPEQTVTLLQVPFKWNAGFRLGFGFELPNNCWDALFSYTRYHTKASAQAQTSSGGIYSPYLGNFFINNADGAGFGPNYRSAGIQWKFEFDSIDAEVARPFYIDSFLELRPVLGMKAAVIKQHIYSQWENPTIPTTFTTGFETIKNDFWGIGPSLGLDSKWALFKGTRCAFHLFGDFSGALMWGHWKFHDVYENNTPATVTLNDSSLNSAATMARGLLGLEWTGGLSDTAFKVRLGYEGQVWFDQLQYFALSTGRLNNLLSMQGGVLEFSLNF